MAVADFAQGIKMSFLATMSERAAAAKAQHSAPAAAIAQTAATAQSTKAADPGFFSDLLDIINPLQHIPVVSTLYRAVTGDKIQPLEQLAGDTLYGGVLGLAASAANLAFKEITGKDVGDTVLAFAENLGGSDTPAAVASTAAPAATAAASGPPQPLIGAKLAADIAQSVPAPAAPAPAPANITPAQATSLSPLLTNADAFMAALKTKNVDPALALRALSAYQKTLGLKPAQ
ncbi:MAG: hypothetical protein KGR48_07440 [Alphaproteobacteria bacterium]|nr:hypothetical protein [Alphaproteobacteria bacterium]MDE2014092.1 hypothetical protein [Alphaproteobacteria bacterium]MDE2072221.1 hypothetical protein [Alphaproteobacteria bacterium]MDE2350686.1 hypothetical protein [Alphaproteobacteria bacterium]